MKLKKPFFANVIALFSTVILVGCDSTSSQKSAPKGTIRTSAKDTISTMDPSLNTDVICVQNLNDTMEGIYHFKGKNIKSALATDLAKPTNNGLTYTFEFRPNAK